MPAPYFQDDQHALSEGLLLGYLLQKGVSARPEMDAEGNYTDVIAVTIEVPDDDSMYVIFVRVLPLPAPRDDGLTGLSNPHDV